MPTEKYIRNLIDESNITDENTRKEILKGSGLYFCGAGKEIVPRFDQAPCETKKEGKYNSCIVLGRDRNADFTSGVGGDGGVQCGMIDLVAGRGQLIMAQNGDDNPLKSIDQEHGIGPSFVTDAARIYITQKSENIDKYFGLKGIEGRTSEFKSAVGIKADHVRVIGREKIKIFCGAGEWEGFEKGVGETNCLGQGLGVGRIELQVGNNSELQPVVLGDNLVEYLKSNQEEIKKMQKMIQDININLSILNSIVGGAVPGAALVCVPQSRQSITHTFATISHVINQVVQEIGSLDSDLIPGANHILSKTVFTT